MGYGKREGESCGVGVGGGDRERIVVLCEREVGGVGRGRGEVGEGKEGKGGESMKRRYERVIVKLREGMRGLEGMFEDGEGWGSERVKGWIDD